MHIIELNGQQLRVTKTEEYFALDCVKFLAIEGGKEYAQKHIDIIMRCSLNDAALNS